MRIMKKILTTILLFILFMSATIVSFAATGVVTVQSLNLREGPSTSTNVIKTIKKNQEFEIIEKSDKWYKIKVNDVIGYVHGDYIKVNEEEKKEEEQREEKQEETNNENENNSNKSEKIENIPEEITITKQVNIYILPLINSTKISKTKENEKITVLAVTNKWIYISASEVNGWISKASVADLINYVEIKNEEVKKEETNTNTNPEETNTIVNNNETTIEETNENTNTIAENTTTEETTSKEEFKQKTMYVVYNSIYVRKGPDTKYDYVDTLVLNNSVLVVGEEGDWYKVKVDGKDGYIAKWLLADSKKSN